MLLVHAHLFQLSVPLDRLQTECSHYKMIAEEAYRQLIEIQQKDILSKSQDVRLKDWLDLMEEVRIHYNVNFVNKCSCLIIIVVMIIFSVVDVLEIGFHVKKNTQKTHAYLLQSK